MEVNENLERKLENAARSILSIEPAGTGIKQVNVEFSYLETARDFVLRCGGAVKVISPPELQGKVLSISAHDGHG